MTTSNARELAELATAYGAGALSGRNRVIGGCMRIDQRNAGAAITTSNNFPVDRFKVIYSVAGGAFSAQRSTESPVGFSHSLKFTATTGATKGSTSLVYINHTIEGYNVADLQWGTAKAQSPRLLSVGSMGRSWRCVSGIIGNSMCQAPVRTMRLMLAPLATTF